MTRKDEVQALIEQNRAGLDDDEIAEMLNMSNRQQIHQICTQLATIGEIQRASIIKPGKRRKIHNFPKDVSLPEAAIAATSVKPGDTQAKPWRRRLAMLIAATGRSEDELLDDALAALATRILREELD